MGDRHLYCQPPSTPCVYRSSGTGSVVYFRKIFEIFRASAHANAGRLRPLTSSSSPSSSSCASSFSNHNHNHHLIPTYHRLHHHFHVFFIPLHHHLISLFCLSTFFLSTFMPLSSISHHPVFILPWPSSCHPHHPRRCCHHHLIS